MAGTVSGGLKAAKKNLERDPDHYRKIGAIGGSVKGTRGGFAFDDRTLLQKILRKPKRARLAGAKGGTISRRGKKNGKN